MCYYLFGFDHHNYYSSFVLYRNAIHNFRENRHLGNKKVHLIRNINFVQLNFCANECATVFEFWISIGYQLFESSIFINCINSSIEKSISRSANNSWVPFPTWGQLRKWRFKHDVLPFYKVQKCYIYNSCRGAVTVLSEIACISRGENRFFIHAPTSFCEAWIKSDSSPVIYWRFWIK